MKLALVNTIYQTLLVTRLYLLIREMARALVLDIERRKCNLFQTNT